MKRILHLVSVTFKSSYNWFKIDIHQQLRPLTANYLAMFKVTSTTIYTFYKAQTKCKTRFNSKGMILNGFQKIIFQNRCGTRDPLETPLLHGKYHLKFPFWLSAPVPKGDFCKNNSLLFERVSDVRFSCRFQPPRQEIIWDKPVRRLELWKHCECK